MNPSVLAQQLQHAVKDYLRLSFETTTPFFEGLVMLQMNLDLAPPPTMELCGISQRLTNRQFHVI